MNRKRTVYFLEIIMKKRIIMLSILSALAYAQDAMSAYAKDAMSQIVTYKGQRYNISGVHLVRHNDLKAQKIKGVNVDAKLDSLFGLIEPIASPVASSSSPNSSGSEDSGVVVAGM